MAKLPGGSRPRARFLRSNLAGLPARNSEPPQPRKEKPAVGSRGNLPKGTVLNVEVLAIEADVVTLRDLSKTTYSVRQSLFRGATFIIGRKYTIAVEKPKGSPNTESQGRIVSRCKWWF